MSGITRKEYSEERSHCPTFKQQGAWWNLSRSPVTFLSKRAVNWPHFLAELLSSHISVPQPVPNTRPNLGLPQLVLLSILEVESQTSCSEFILTKQIFAQGLAFPAGLFSARECSSHGLCQFKTHDSSTANRGDLKPGVLAFYLTVRSRVCVCRRMGPQ